MCGLTAFFILCTDEKDGLKASLKDSNRLIEEVKQREVQLQSRVNSLEQQVNVLTGRDQEVGSALTGGSMVPPADYFQESPHPDVTVYTNIGC